MAAGKAGHSGFRGMDNAPPEMGCEACGPLPETELRRLDIKVSNTMVEAARHSREKCEEPVDAVAREVGE